MKAVVFDFDYTLADSSKGIIKCVTMALQQMGYHVPSHDFIKKTIGLSLANTFITLTNSSNPENIENFKKLFMEHSRNIMFENTYIYDGVHKVFEILHQHEYKIGIVSTKHRSTIERILNGTELLNYLDIIIGGEDVIQQKPNPEGLLRASHNMSVDSNDVIYIGDSTIDAMTAKNANIGTFIAVLTGTTLKEDFVNYNCLAILPHVNTLPNFLKLLN